MAVLHIAGQAEAKAVIRNISLGGMSLGHDRQVPSGTTMQVELPAGGTVSGRVVRSEGGELAISLRQDAATQALVTKTLDAFRHPQRKQAA